MIPPSMILPGGESVGLLILSVTHYFFSPILASSPSLCFLRPAS